MLPLSASIHLRSAECWSKHLPSGRMYLVRSTSQFGLFYLADLSLVWLSCAMQNSYCFALKSSSDKSKEQKAPPLHRLGTFQGGSLSRGMSSCLSWLAVDLPYPAFIIHFCYAAFAEFTSPLACVVYAL